MMVGGGAMASPLPTHLISNVAASKTANLLKIAINAVGTSEFEASYQTAI